MAAAGVAAAVALIPSLAVALALVARTCPLQEHKEFHQEGDGFSPTVALNRLERELHGLPTQTRSSPTPD